MTQRPDNSVWRRSPWAVPAETAIRLVLPSLILIAAARGAGAQEAGAAHGGGGLLETLGIEWRAVLIQICGFALLFLFLRKFLFGPLQTALSTRRSEIQGAYDRVEEQQRTIDRQRAELEARLASVESEARERIQAAVNEAKTLQDQILAEARQRSEREIEQARVRIRMEEEKAMAVLREQMATLAIQAAGQLIGESLNDERHRRLVTDFISRVGS